MKSIHRRVIPVLVFALSALATLAMADYAYPPPTWQGADACEPYSHSDSTAGGCDQCCRDHSNPNDDGSSYLHCSYCCGIRNHGDPNGPPHCVASKNPVAEDPDQTTL